jgi:eukaryotic-like serine/threonine-protein kinase
MRLAPGTFIGSFEIRDLIGVGGMGEVYRATDAELKRDVAIKVLPEALAGDKARLDRLQREAEILASLNHSHIAQIYGVERSGNTTALVLELVDGQTLAERLLKEPIPVDEALSLAAQIAAALEAAHAKGIVHRDLKPANVKLRRDGSIKVLDFGIAKATDAARGDGGAASEPAMTETGAVVGTVAYMSPEQARGNPVDKRTDIFAFGALLFEMLAGQPPFLGEDVTDTIAAVIRSEPNWKLLPALPPLVEAFLRQCLRKQPAERLHDIGDMRLALLGAFDLPGTQVVGQRSTTWVQRAGVAAAVTALVAIAVVAGRMLAPDAEPAVISGTEIFPLRPPIARGLQLVGERMVAITRDGGRVAYVSAGSIWLQTPGRQDAVPIARGGLPVFSVDGDWIAVFADSQTLTKVSVYDGVPIPLASLGDAGRLLGADWLGDDIVVATQAGLYRVSANEENGQAELLISAAADETYAWPQFLPDGKSVLVTVLSGNTMERASIALLDLETATISAPLVRGGVGARYVASGSGSGGLLVYAADGRGRLATRPFDPATGEVGTVPAFIPDVEVQVAGLFLAAAFDVSDDGALAFVSSRPPANPNRLVWWDHDGVEEVIDATLPGSVVYPRAAPDGERIAFEVFDGPGGRRIWTMDLDRAIPSRLTESSDSGPVYEDIGAVWARDGDRVYFSSNRLGSSRIWSRAANGSGADVELATPADVGFPLDWTPDDRLLVMGADYATADIGLLDPADPANVTWIVESPVSEVTPAVSRDGRWVAYASNEGGGRYEIFVQSLLDPNLRLRVSRNGGAEPVWGLAGSNELYYIGNDDADEPGMLAATLELAGEPEVIDERVLFRKPQFSSLVQPSGLRHYDMSPRDGRFLFTQRQLPQNVDPDSVFTTIWYVRHWAEGL